MKDSFSFLTPKQAGDLAGYTARHMLNIIKSGKLTATREDGNYYIDKAEFFRVFPEAHKKMEQRNARNITDEQARIEAEIENKFLRESIIDKEKQNEYLKQQLENFTHEKNKLIDVLHSNTRLLEHKKEDKAASESGKEHKSWLDVFKRDKKD